MNIDEAKKISKEHDALEILQKRIFAFRDSARPEATDPAPFGVEDKDLNYLVPLLERRIKDLALMFQPEAAPVNPVRQITVEPGRPKVKPAVAAKWAEFEGQPVDKRFFDWEVWALQKGFKWASVQSCLRELEKQRKDQERAERLKNPLNAGVADAAQNFASQHDADVQKDALLKLAITATRG